MDWVSKKVSNDVCTIPREIRVTGRVRYKFWNNVRGFWEGYKKMNDRLLSERRYSSANLSKYKERYQYTLEMIRTDPLDFDSGLYKEASFPKGDTYRRSESFSLEDVIQVKIYKQPLPHVKVESEMKGTSGCWIVQLNTKGRAVRHTLSRKASYQEAFKTWDLVTMSSVEFYFSDKSMAKRVKKALEHAVKLAKAEELF
jgi:hypothetical protein